MIAHLAEAVSVSNAAVAFGAAFGAFLGQQVNLKRFRKVVNEVVAPLEAKIKELEARSHADLVTRLERLEGKAHT